MKKIKKTQAKRPAPPLEKASKAEVDQLTEKIKDKIEAHPDKAAIILADWLKKASHKKAA